MPDSDSARLQAFIDTHDSLVVLTGAGISTASGIPDYRDRNGDWKRAPPMTFQTFTASVEARQRYWARSFVGWPVIAAARPNAAHAALARLEACGRIGQLITQNVDGLHSRAGQQRVIDLHGRLDQVVCLGCHACSRRAELQIRLQEANPDWLVPSGPLAPDGDADLEGLEFERFSVPDCLACGGMLKPDVVFFGESVPRERVVAAFNAVDDADAMLIVGSSLMVFSGYRFARRAVERGLPIAAINPGRGRADAQLSLKIGQPAELVLASLPSSSSPIT